MKHRIQRQQFLLTLPPAIDAFRAQQAAGRFFHEQLLPMLEAIFDELCGEDEVLRLDTCVIDLQFNLASLDAHDTDAAIFQQLRAELTRVIAHELRLRPQLRYPAPVTAWEAWRHYMEKSYLPWNADPPDHNELQKVLAHLAVDYESVSWLRRALRLGSPLLTRVVEQHDEEFLSQLVVVLTASRQPNLAAIMQNALQLIRHLEKHYRQWVHVTNPPPTAQRLNRWAERLDWLLSAPARRRPPILWSRLLATAALQPDELAHQGAAGLLLQELEGEPELLELALTGQTGPDDDPVRTWLLAARARSGARHPATETPPAEDRPKQPTPTKPAPAETTAAPPHAGPNSAAQSPVTSNDPGNDADPTEAVEPDGLFVTHAGLILLHPFLSTLFHRVGYWDGSGFKDFEARRDAVFLAGWLATGELHTPEYALAFPKILCGFPLELPLPQDWELPPEVLEEAGVMLENVLIRWEKLGSTSVAGLRESFLQRGGRLSKKDGRLTLQLETSSIDILLDYLPWTLSLVKLPWWKQILYVDWR